MLFRSRLLGGNVNDINQAVDTFSRLQQGGANMVGRALDRLITAISKSPTSEKLAQELAARDARISALEARK
mgnify:FL=1